jgi:hypothetical protein
MLTTIFLILLVLRLFHIINISYLLVFSPLFIKFVWELLLDIFVIVCIWYYRRF